VLDTKVTETGKESLPGVTVVYDDP
jgi:hypothetical protein